MLELMGVVGKGYRSLGETLSHVLVGVDDLGLRDGFSICKCQYKNIRWLVFGGGVGTKDAITYSLLLVNHVVGASQKLLDEENLFLLCCNRKCNCLTTSLYW